MQPRQHGRRRNQHPLHLFVAQREARTDKNTCKMQTQRVFANFDLESTSAATWCLLSQRELRPHVMHRIDIQGRLSIRKQLPILRGVLFCSASSQKKPTDRLKEPNPFAFNRFIRTDWFEVALSRVVPRTETETPSGLPSLTSSYRLSLINNSYQKTW